MFISRARTRRAPRAGLHRPRARAAADAGALHRGRAGGRPEGVRDAGQPGRLAGRARALRHHAARAGAGARDRAGRERGAADLRQREVLRARPAPRSAARRRPGGSTSATAGRGRARSSRTRSWPRRFRQVAEGGAEVFYRGPIAKTIARAVTEAGGWLARGGPGRVRAGVAASRWPSTTAAGGLLGAAARSPRSRCCETLNILEGYDLAGWGHNSPDYLHHLIEAIKLGSADRLAYAYSRRTRRSRAWCRKAYAASQRARIDPARAGGRARASATTASGWPARSARGIRRSFENEQTTHFACADAEGSVVSVTQTLGRAVRLGLRRARAPASC